MLNCSRAQHDLRTVADFVMINRHGSFYFWQSAKLMGNRHELTAYPNNRFDGMLGG